jgi:hypothetical protein
LTELSHSIYAYTSFGGYPKWSKEQQSLVEYGIARFVEGRTPVNINRSVQVDEPLALVAIVRYFESQHLTLGCHIRATLQDNRESVLLAITKLMQGRRDLNQVFQFREPTPGWADYTAKIVTRISSGNYVDFDVIREGSVLRPIGLAVYAKTPEAVECWLQGGGAGWCIPEDSMGPELMAWLRLDDGSDDGRFLLLIIQAKCPLIGNIDTLSAEATADAIRSLIPSKFFASLV